MNLVSVNNRRKSKPVAVPAEVKNDPRWEPFTRAMYTTWQAIASDVADMCESNEECIEFCIDHDCLDTYGKNEQASSFLRELFDKYQYMSVMTILNRNINLW